MPRAAHGISAERGLLRRPTGISGLKFGISMIEVIDLLKSPQLARGDQIIAVPTLVRKLPEPVRKIIGDLSNKEKVLVELDLIPRPQERGRGL
jgi:hypothetical protein